MKLLAVVSLALVIAVASAVPALAGKPAKPFLTVSPANPSAAGTATSSTATFTLSGCGYTKLTTIIVWHNYTGPYTEVTPDENGCVSATFSPFGLDPTGTYVGQAWQKKGQSWENDPSAEITFTVS
jgi:hypothetical protein